MVKPAKETMRVVVFQDSDTWIAQGLEHDVCAQSSDLESLPARFIATLTAEIQQAREDGKPALDIGPAPEHFFQMWEERSSFSVKLDGSNNGHVELALCA